MALARVTVGHLWAYKRPDLGAAGGFKEVVLLNSQNGPWWAYFQCLLGAAWPAVRVRSPGLASRRGVSRVGALISTQSS